MFFNSWQTRACRTVLHESQRLMHVIEEDLHMQHKTKGKQPKLHSQSELFFQT